MISPHPRLSCGDRLLSVLLGVLALSLNQVSFSPLWAGEYELHFTTPCLQCPVQDKTPDKDRPMFTVRMGIKSSAGITAKQLDLTPSSPELIIKSEEVTQSSSRAQNSWAAWSFLDLSSHFT